MSQTFKNVHVLVIDSNVGIQTILLSLIRALGFPNIKLATDGVEARAMLPGVRPDLIICNLNFPASDGLDFANWLRNDVENPFTAVPIIMVSSDTEERSVKACLQAGVNQLLAMPVTGKAMATRIRRIIMDKRPFVREPGYAGPQRTPSAA